MRVLLDLNVVLDRFLVKAADLTVEQSGRIGRTGPSEGGSSARAMIADKKFGKIFKPHQNNRF